MVDWKVIAGGAILAGGAVYAFLDRPKASGDPIPAQTKRIVLLEPNPQTEKAKLEIQDVAVPKPKRGQVLVRMAAAPINPSDYGEWKSPNPAVTYPIQIGKEGAGVVVASGGGWYAGSLVGKTVGVLAGMVKGLGTYQGYLALPATSVFPITDVKAEDACSFFVNPFTAFAIYECSKKRSKAVVHTAAASQLGQMLVKFCKEQKDLVVISVVRRQDQAELLKQIDPSVPVVVQAEGDWKAKLKDMIKEYKCSTAFECVSGDLTGEILSCMPPKSVTFVYGGLSGKNVSNIPTMDLIYRGKQVKGFLVSDWINFKDPIGAIFRFRRALGHVNRGLKPGGWATSQFKDCSMTEMKKSFDEMMAPNASVTGQKLRVRLDGQ